MLVARAGLNFNTQVRYAVKCRVGKVQLSGEAGAWPSILLRHAAVLL